MAIDAAQVQSQPVLYQHARGRSNKESRLHRLLTLTLWVHLVHPHGPSWSFRLIQEAPSPGTFANGSGATHCRKPDHSSPSASLGHCVVSLTGEPMQPQDYDQGCCQPSRLFAGTADDYADAYPVRLKLHSCPWGGQKTGTCG